MHKTCHTKLSNLFFPDWFYHAPSKKSSKSAKPAPPASQIPGIGGLKDELANPEQDDRHFRRKWIRDTDSKYIKLAKAGGRKNLLAFRSPPTKADEPVPYPRVDWFDHDPPEEEDLNEVQHTVQHDEQHTNSKQGYACNFDCRTFYMYICHRDSKTETITEIQTFQLSWMGETYFKVFNL